MSIRINIPFALYYYTDKQRVVEVDGGTVGECLDHLVEQHPGIRKMLFEEEGRLFDYFDILVNRHTSYPEGLARQVRDGDELTIVFDALAGG